MGNIINSEDRERLHEQLDNLIDRQHEVGSLAVAKAVKWEMGYKDKDMTAQSHPLYAVTLEADKSKLEPSWPPVNRVESTPIRRRRIPRTAGSLAIKRAVVLSDTHYPFQDDQAISTALAVIDDLRPDQIIHAGDLLDMTAWSDKFVVSPEWANSTQDSMIAAHGLLRTLRSMSPSVTLLEGNHEDRMPRMLLKNAQAAYNLRPADQPEGWPAMSVPNMLGLDKLDVRWGGGYPANRYFINDKLQVRHGHITKGPGKTAGAVVMDERVSTVTGHKHTIESSYRTVNSFGGGRTYAAHTIGCLCLLDGRVPGVRSGSDNGENVPNYLNWQQGIGLVEYAEADGPFDFRHVYINSFDGYRAHNNGKVYQP